ncbi:MAG: hypothetical protein ABIQ39_08510, partial [Ilumatobacteraceae bacterium]
MAAEALEQSMLESKDKEQLFAIAQALGIKTTARAAKATLIDKILETTRPATPVVATQVQAEVPAVAGVELAEAGSNGHQSHDNGDASGVKTSPGTARNAAKGGRGSATKSTASASADQPSPQQELLGEDGEPLADWEIELIQSNASSGEALNGAAAEAGVNTSDQKSSDQKSSDRKSSDRKSSDSKSSDRNASHSKTSDDDTSDEREAGDFHPGDSGARDSGTGDSS